MNSTRHYRYRISVGSQNLSCPFVCHLLPSVCLNHPLDYPLVGLNKPFIRNRGVTLIELIIVLTIAGVLAALAAPSIQRLVASNRLTAQVNDLLADINLARSEAIKRNTKTGICVTAAGGTACVGGGNWVNGWLVYYVCPAGDPSGCVVDSNVTVKMHEVFSGNNTLTGPADALVYKKQGVVDSGAGQFTLTDPNITNTSGRRIVCVTPTGRPNLSQVNCP
jgi:type IV fimbrial biogenesis protein FimT